MAFRFILLFLLQLPIAVELCAQPPGTWSDHLPYMQARQVRTAGDVVIAATPWALFTVNTKDNTIERLSKINGLSEAGISALETDSITGKIIVAYANSNIDLIAPGHIINLNQLVRSNISVDKSINSITVYKRYALLSTAFGIVVIDLEKNEVKETYLIGSGGRQLHVQAVAANSSFIYAATEEGLKRAATSNVNLADFRNWQPVIGPWSGNSVSKVIPMGESIIVQASDSLWINEQDAWKLFYVGEKNISNINASTGRLVVTERNDTHSRVVVFNNDGTMYRVFEEAGIVLNPLDAVFKNEQIWIADSISGLLQSSNDIYKRYQPNSPFTVPVGEMVIQHDNLWITPGSGDRNREAKFVNSSFSQYTKQEWKNYLPAEFPALDSLNDAVSVAVSKKDNSVWIGSLGGGLLRFSEKQIPQVFKQSSFIAPSLFDNNQYRVTGLAFDNDFNLWIANDGASETLVVRKNDGSVRKFTPPFTLHKYALSQILIDESGQKWIVGEEGNGLLLFNHGVSIDNTGDDQWKWYRAGKGNGNLPDNQVLALAMDKSGFLWIGTNKGIGIIQCAAQAFSAGGCEAILPIVQQDNFAGYLFSNEQVQAIAVNGADQKWIATKHGVWLVSSDGSKTVRHFTAQNSPLLSNDVRKIAIDPKTGDVYFATANGLCAFRDFAIEGKEVNEQLLVFPNPVPPGFSGNIAIRGVVNNAIVKITELDGRLVYETRALGGQVVWNGRDYRGRQISSGVYLIMVSDEMRKEKASGKIVFISR